MAFLNTYDTLKEVKKLLESVKNVKTLKIGIEPNISPSDYPIIRIVSTRNELNNDDLWSYDIYFNVYFGAKLDEKIGLEKIYQALYTMEKDIKEALHNVQIPKGDENGLIRFVDTQSDNDELKNFKILCSGFKIISVR